MNHRIPKYQGFLKEAPHARAGVVFAGSHGMTGGCTNGILLRRKREEDITDAPGCVCFLHGSTRGIGNC